MSLQSRARSVPFKRPFYVALIYSSVFYFAFIAAITAAVSYAILLTKESAYLLVALTGASLFLWFLSFMKRRNARCPLCQGTPFLETGAHLHEKAYKLPIINYGHTNVVRVLFTMNCRCMYCGTPYDFLKPVTYGQADIGKN